jgi:hypothetical protein
MTSKLSLSAFGLHSGKVRGAPVWVRDHGLEWLFRLASEPGRLWQRYLITIPKAVWFVCLELLGFWIWTFAQGKDGAKAASNSMEESSVS